MNTRLGAEVGQEIWGRGMFPTHTREETPYDNTEVNLDIDHTVGPTIAKEFGSTSLRFPILRLTVDGLFDGNVEDAVNPDEDELDYLDPKQRELLLDADEMIDPSTTLGKGNVHDTALLTPLERTAYEYTGSATPWAVDGFDLSNIL